MSYRFVLWRTHGVIGSYPFLLPMMHLSRGGLLLTLLRRDRALRPAMTLSLNVW